MARGGVKVERGAMASWDQGLHYLWSWRGRRFKGGRREVGKEMQKPPQLTGSQATLCIKQ